MLIDLHSHSWPLSDDSMLEPDDLIARTKAAGIDGICLTEHDFFWDHEKVRQLAAKHQFLVLSGVELNTEDGHMLVYGLHRYTYGMHRVRDLAEMIETAGGAMVAAHPYRRNLSWRHTQNPDEHQQALERAKRVEAYQHVVALETENGRGSERENQFSRDLAAAMSLSSTAGTDSHAERDIARCATYFEADIQSLDDLIRELKAGHFYPVKLQGITK